MTFHVLTLFPEIPQAYFDSSIMAKAVSKGIVNYNLVNIRDYANDKHKTCDEKPYGASVESGSAGMLMTCEPIANALKAIGCCEKSKTQKGLGKTKRVVYLSPSGKLFNQELANELLQEEELVFICGRYEGIDQRIIDLYVDDEISLGDYVMSSGELAATVVIDTIYRLIEGVISKQSLEDESFQDNLLEYPQYTRPEIFRGLKVPEVLLSGHHKKIRTWRLRKSIEKTLRVRPDLIQKIKSSGFTSREVKVLLEELENGNGFNS